MRRTCLVASAIATAAVAVGCSSVHRHQANSGTRAPSTPATATPAGADSGVRCTARAVHATVTFNAGAGGTASDLVSVTNRAATPCQLRGYALVRFTDRGLVLPIAVKHGRTYAFPSAPVRRIALAPGSAASFLIGYPDSNNTAPSKPCLTADAVSITLPGDVEIISLGLDARNHLMWPCVAQADSQPFVAGTHGYNFTNVR